MISIFFIISLISYFMVIFLTKKIYSINFYLLTRKFPTYFQFDKLLVTLLTVLKIIKR